jgi:hypothetical protein
MWNTDTQGPAASSRSMPDCVLPPQLAPLGKLCTPLMPCAATARRPAASRGWLNCRGEAEQGRAGSTAVHAARGARGADAQQGRADATRQGRDDIFASLWRMEDWGRGVAGGVAGK